MACSRTLARLALYLTFVARGFESCDDEVPAVLPLQLKLSKENHSAGLVRFMRRGEEPCPGYSGKIDMNNRMCLACCTPFKERTDREYVQRSDCGNQSVIEHPENQFVPLIAFSKEASDGHNATNAWCELNVQTTCADSLYNQDFLYQAKSFDYDRKEIMDPTYCQHNGWLAPEVVALQHDFEGMKAKSEEWCNQERVLKLGWNSTITYASVNEVWDRANPRGYPTEDESLFLGAWTCAMGSAGCDMTYCAYSFCDKGNGTFGMYEECEGWDPVQGMPM